MVPPQSGWEPGLLILVYSLIGIAAAITAVTLSGFNVDLFVSGLFFDPATGTFAGPYARYVAMFRDHGAVAIVTCVLCVALATTKYLPRKVPGISNRAAIFLVASILLGPGLLANTVAKDNSHRPRPGMVTEFGGQQKFVNWWDFSGTCGHNCSFVAGEPATAAWMFAPAMLAVPQWRTAAMVGAGVFTAVIGLVRLAAGGHFFSDVIFGVLLTLLVVLATFEAVFRWPWGAFGSRHRSTGTGNSAS
jgi:lipid A 4'-phosphatase